MSLTVEWTAQDIATFIKMVDTNTLKYLLTYSKLQVAFMVASRNELEGTDEEYVAKVNSAIDEREIEISEIAYEVAQRTGVPFEQVVE
ncbi:MAG: hypothetical protein RBT66_09745 [bacterium]|jgi:hypothetical protein|nr:hypothetical protein [bacterium]